MAKKTPQLEAEEAQEQTDLQAFAAADDAAAVALSADSTVPDLRPVQESAQTEGLPTGESSWDAPAPLVPVTPAPVAPKTAHEMATARLQKARGL